MSGAAVDERQAPVEPEEGSGATKKQRTGGEAVAKAGSGFLNFLRVTGINNNPLHLLRESINLASQ